MAIGISPAWILPETRLQVLEEYLSIKASYLIWNCEGKSSKLLMYAPLARGYKIQTLRMSPSVKVA